MKKLFCILLVIVLIFSNFVTALALTEEKTTNGEQVLLKCKTLLEQIAPYKELFGLEDAIISQLYLGSEIPVYEFKNNQLEAMDFRYIPLENSEGNIVALFIVSVDLSGDIRVEYTTEFIQNLNSSEEIRGIVYDASRMILVRDELSEVLHEETVFNNSRDNANLETLIGLVGFANVSYDEYFESKIKIDFNKTNRDAPVSRMINVPIYTQGSNTQYCWACCLVSVGKYFFPSTNYNPATIAVEETGNTQTATTLLNTNLIMNMRYPLISNGIEYEYETSILNYSMVYPSINNGYPIIARESTGQLANGHIVVICGYSSTGDTYSYMMMDPLSSNYRAGNVSSNGTLEYIRTSSGTQTIMRDSLQVQ